MVYGGCIDVDWQLAVCIAARYLIPPRPRLVREKHLHVLLFQLVPKRWARLKNPKSFT
jgi:hypothetical protein